MRVPLLRETHTHTRTKRKISGSLTQHTKPVVHGHNNHIAVGGEDAGIKHVAGSFHVGASVNKQHHRLLPAVTNIYTEREEEERESGGKEQKEKSITVFRPL